MTKFKLASLTLLLISCGFVASCSTSTTTSSGATSSSSSVSSTASAQEVFSVPPAGDDIIGRDEKITLKSGDSLNTIAHQYDVGYEELADANPNLNLYKLRAGQKLLLPMERILPPEQYRKGIVINVAELRLYYFSPDGKVMTYPVALGREGWRTPVGKTYVYRKQEKPTWNVPATVKQYMLATHGKVLPDVVQPGAENPLGDYAIYLALNGYLIHGTNTPTSIGRLVSSGCIRMYNSDVSQIFPTVAKGTPVYIIYYPNKVGWRGNTLYMESHKPVSHEKQLYQAEEVPVDQLLKQATQMKVTTVNWDDIKESTSEERGTLIAIGQS